MKSILGAMGGAYWPRNEKIAPKNGFIAPRNENNKADDFVSEGVFRPYFVGTGECRGLGLD